MEFFKDLWDFSTGLWNAVVSVLPTIGHAACEILNSASDAAKLGGGG